MQKNLNDSKNPKKKDGASKKSTSKVSKQAGNKMSAPNKTFNKTSDKSDDYQDSDY